MFKDRQAMVDDTRVRIGTTNYKKEGHFMIRDGDRCLSNHDGTAMFFECNMNSKQLWKLNRHGVITSSSGECVDESMNIVPCENPATLRGSLKENTFQLNDGRCVIKGDVRSMVAVPIGSTSGSFNFRVANNLNTIDHDFGSDYVTTQTIRYIDTSVDRHEPSELKNKFWTQDQYDMWNNTLKHHDKTFNPIAIKPFCKHGKVQESENGRRRCVEHYSASHDAVLGTCPSGRNILFANKAPSNHETTTWCGDKGTRAVSTGASCEKHPTWNEPFERGSIDIQNELKEYYDYVYSTNKLSAKSYYDTTINLKPKWYEVQWERAPAPFNKWWECRWKNKLHPYWETMIDESGDCSMENLNPKYKEEEVIRNAANNFGGILS